MIAGRWDADVSLSAIEPRRLTARDVIRPALPEPPR